MNPELLKKYIDSMPDEEVVAEEEIPKNIVVWKGHINNQKKVGVTYICEKCGRKKTKRYEHIPAPKFGGMCPRCKNGTMIAEDLIKEVKVNE